MIIRRKLIYALIIIFLTSTITSISLLINNSIILTRIYYRVNYGANVQNFESIIEKSEIFEYEKYCTYRDYPGEDHNLTRSDPYEFIDRVFIESLKLQIDEDKKKFHFFPPFQLNFIYSLEVSNESLIYLTYNNNTIIKAEYADHTEIFTASLAFWDINSPHWIGIWYLNFSHIPYALNKSSTIILTNTFLVKMNLKYNDVPSFWESSYLTIEQYLLFNSDFQIMFVFLDSNVAVQ